MKRENPPLRPRGVPGRHEGLALLSAALDERACREELGFGTFVFCQVELSKKGTGN